MAALRSSTQVHQQHFVLNRFHPSAITSRLNDFLQADDPPLVSPQAVFIDEYVA